MRLRSYLHYHYKPQEGRLRHDFCHVQNIFTQSIVLLVENIAGAQCHIFKLRGNRSNFVLPELHTTPIALIVKGFLKQVSFMKPGQSCPVLLIYREMESDIVWICSFQLWVQVKSLMEKLNNLENSKKSLEEELNRVRYPAKSFRPTMKC